MNTEFLKPGAVIVSGPCERCRTPVTWVEGLPPEGERLCITCIEDREFERAAEEPSTVSVLPTEEVG